MIKSSGMNFPAQEKMKTVVVEIVVPATADVVVDIKFFSECQSDKLEVIFLCHSFKIFTILYSSL